MDLTQPGAAIVLADTIKTAIDNNSATDSPPKHSWRVSPSSLGDECVARQWFKFRWVVRRQVPGRIARLFARGHGREAHFIALLRRAGWTVEDIDPDHKHPSFPQFRIKLFGGHMSGYLDAKGSHPELTGGVKGLLEFKTYNTKRFSHLTRHKVKVADFEYYVQVCLYMKEHDLPWCLFLAENKNDDDIYAEVILRDDATAEHYLRTAHTVIFSKARPARFAESPAHHVCKLCDYVGVCHNSAPVEINCRSCQFCTPIDGGKFQCDKWQAVIPDEKAMLAACPQHTPVV